MIEQQTISDIQEQSPDDLALIKHIREKVEEVNNSSSRNAHMSNWMCNIAALLGFDGLTWDAQSKQFRSTNNTPALIKKNRLHINRILPTIQNRLARLTKSRPKYKVKPNSPDEDDKEAARLSEQVLDMIWDKEEMDVKFLDLLMWTQQCGHAYLKVSWDASMGKPIDDTEYEGDIRVDVVSPFEIFPDPLANNDRDCAWMVQAKVRKLDYFRMHYPERGHLVKEEGAWLLAAQYENRINSINSNSGTGANATSQLKNAAIEMTYYERRSPKHPDGRMIVIANGVKLEEKDLPCGEIPLVKFDDIAISGKYYSESVITHMRPPQEQFNRLMTKRAQWTNRVLTGKIIAARGSNIIKEGFNDQSGEIVYYDYVPGAPPPMAVDMPVMPSYAYKEEESLLNHINDIGGINETSRGQAPGSGITAAIALQYLSEQDDTRIGIMSRRNEKCMARFFKYVLMYACKLYITPRILQIAGQNLEYTVKSFVGMDLNNNYDVHVIEGSTLPGSITAKRDFTLAIAERGWLGDPNNPKVQEKVLKAIEFGDMAELWQDFGLDMSQIKKAVDLLKQGEMPPINELDNHELYILEINRFRKSDGFEKMPPMNQQMTMDFIEEHIQAMVNLASPGLDDQKANLQSQLDTPPPMPMDQGMAPQEQPLMEGAM